jgi:hypothetical protein
MRGEKQGRRNIQTFSVLCRQRTEDFSVGEETGERSKQQGGVSGVRCPRREGSLSVKNQGRSKQAAGSPASAQGGGVSGVRVGGVRAGRGVSDVRRRSKQGVSGDRALS